MSGRKRRVPLRRSRSASTPSQARGNRSLLIKIPLVIFEVIKKILGFVWHFALFWTTEIINVLKHLLKIFTGPERLHHLACISGATIFAFLAILAVSIIFPGLGPIFAALTIGALNLAWAGLIGGALIFAPIGCRLVEKLLRWDPISKAMRTKVQQLHASEPHRQSRIFDAIKQIRALITEKLDAASLFHIRELRLIDPTQRGSVQHYLALRKDLEKGNYESVRSFLKAELNPQEHALQRLYNDLTKGGKITNIPELPNLKLGEITEHDIRTQFRVFRNKLNSLPHLPLPQNIHTMEEWFEHNNAGLDERTYARQLAIFELWKRSAMRYHFFERYHLSAFSIESSIKNPQLLDLFESAVSIERAKHPAQSDSSYTLFIKRELDKQEEEIDSLYHELTFEHQVDDAFINKKLLAFNDYFITLDNHIPLERRLRQVEEWALAQSSFPNQNSMRIHLAIFSFWKKNINRHNFVDTYHLEAGDLEKHLRSKALKWAPLFSASHHPSVLDLSRAADDQLSSDLESKGGSQMRQRKKTGEPIEKESTPPSKRDTSSDSSDPKSKKSR